MVSIPDNPQAAPRLDMVTRAPSRLPAGVGALAVGFALISALATFLVITGNTPIVPTHEVVVGVLAVNAVLVVLLMVLIVWEIWPLWVAHRQGTAAARLHGRIVVMFCVVAAVPAIVVAIVSSVTLSGGLDRWFSERTRGIVDNAATVARAYMTDQGVSLRNEMVAMATDLNREQATLTADPQRLQIFVTNQANIRNLPVVRLVRRDRAVVVAAQTGFPGQVPAPPQAAVDQAESDEPVMMAPSVAQPIGLVGGVLRLSAFEDTFLFAARTIDTRIVRYLADAEETRAEYEIVQLRRAGVQLAFGLMYAGIAFILLLSAIWFGIAFANRMVAPIRRLIGAADQVSRGNLYVQVPVNPSEGDLAQLGQTFNAMTTGLRLQRDELLAASGQIDERRRFTEAVLSGVSAGVIGVDTGLVVTLANRSALSILDVAAEDALIGKKLSDVVPELAPLLAEAAQSQRLAQGEVTVPRRGRDRNLAVKVTSERTDAKNHGFVVTLDDITDLVTAQRSAAWADVARRIAHEIKNPLTPIQLSAERLKRKYGKLITTDKDVFDQCTDTIIRQVSDIGRMVDEFSSFARMPKAQIAADDIVETVKQVVFLMRVGNPDIEIAAEMPETRVSVPFDRRLISQAVTNIVKNATEAVSAVPDLAPGEGKITVRLDVGEHLVTIDVVDNGIGLPAENRQRLLEPYMTTREKGTGLGLAIVRKILEEHGGSIELLDAPDTGAARRGALVRLTLPRDAAAAAAAAKA
jgi:two-component system nitrogen regulation sensor histidine kinase NtrY